MVKRADYNKYYERNIANFFDDPTSYLQIGNQIYDLADPNTYINAVKGIGEGGKHIYEQSKEAYEQVGKAAKQVIKSLPKIHENSGLADAYINTMSKINPKAYAPEVASGINIPSRLYPPGFKGLDIPYQRLSTLELLGIETGDALSAGEQLDNYRRSAQQWLADKGTRAAGYSTGVLGGLYGSGKGVELASKAGLRQTLPKPLLWIYNSLPGINIPTYPQYIGNPDKQNKSLGHIANTMRFTMKTHSYMANFAFTAKPIMNITVKKKALEAFNKKMSRLVQSGDLVNQNAAVRRSALANAAKLKQRIQAA